MCATNKCLLTLAVLFDGSSHYVNVMQQFHDVAKEELRMCEHLVHDQHLQHQGWAAVIANLEDITRYRLTEMIFIWSMPIYSDYVMFERMCLLPSHPKRSAMVMHFGLFVCLSVCLYVRTRNSKTIAPIDLIFLHKEYSTCGSFLLENCSDWELDSRIY